MLLLSAGGVDPNADTIIHQRDCCQPDLGHAHLLGVIVSAILAIVNVVTAKIAVILRGFLRGADLAAALQLGDQAAECGCMEICSSQVCSSQSKRLLENGRALEDGSSSYLKVA